MPLFLAHVFVLGAFSFFTARKLATNSLDRLIGAAILFWCKVVATCLLLSLAGRLNDQAWLFRGSLLLAGLLCGLVTRLTAPGPGEPAEQDDPAPNPLLLAVAGLSLLLVLAGNVAIASAYSPNNYDSLTYHLPRSIYYLGHNSLAHFQTADFRQVYYPFNFNLLQLLAFAYGAPAKAATFFNIAAWALAGLAVYRAARLCDCRPNASLVAAWLTLSSLEILAQATSTILDLPCGAALIAAVVFTLRWRHTGRHRDALLAGAAVSMSLGTKLTAVFFLPALGLMLVVFALNYARRGDVRGFATRLGQWIAPGLLAVPLGASYIFYNYAATGEAMTHRMDFTLNKPFELACGFHTAKAYLVQICADPLGRFNYDLDFISSLNQWFAVHVFSDWNPRYVFSPLYTIPPDLNEDHVFFGFAGPLILGCAVLCWWRDPKLRRPVTWLAVGGLGWFAAYFVTNKWSLYNQRYFVPPVVLLGPCVAAILETGWTGTGLLARAKRWVFCIVIAAAAWSGGFYLLKNTIRPVPLPGVTLPNHLPPVPPLLVERLTAQRRINVDSYGTNERIFQVMAAAWGRQFTSGHTIDPDRYHLFSFWKATRNHIYSNLEFHETYTLLPFPGKTTSGIEFIGTMEERLAESSDFLGLLPSANEIPANPANSNVLVTVEYSPDASDPIRLGNANFRVVGLNPRDHATVRISAEHADGTREEVLSISHHDWVRGSVHHPFRRLVIEILDQASGRVLTEGEIPFTVRQTDFVAAPGLSRAPVGEHLLFGTELVSGEAVRNMTLTGLASFEGPYPQWDLPQIRWAKQPTVRITVPADPKLRTLRLSFSLRLQVRNTSELEVLHNGISVQRFSLFGSTEWLDRTLEIPANPGVNVIELVDRSGGDVPDWLGYLDLNPDVKKYVLSQNVAPEVGAKQHYDSNGRTEGRYLPMRASDAAAPPPPDSLYYVYRSLRLDGLSGQ